MKSGEVWNPIAHDVQQEEPPLLETGRLISHRGISEEPLSAERPWRGVSMRGLFAGEKKKSKKHKEHLDRAKDSEYLVVFGLLCLPEDIVNAPLM